MKRTLRLLLAGAVLTTGSCQDFLDVNTNPNSPQSITPILYMPSLIHYMVTSPMVDGLRIGEYTQEWMNTGNTTTSNGTGNFPKMGYVSSSDTPADLWRTVYWLHGQNLVDLMNKAEAEERWDVLGVGYFIKAWGWYALTSVHGEIIIKQAIDPTRFKFDYDSQEFAYQEIERLLLKSIELLQRTDGKVDVGYLAKGDKLYNGDRAKWIKLAYGLLALSKNHFSNKAAYKPADVIANVDKSFASSADEAIFAFPAAGINDDRSYYGITRGNINNYRQTTYILGLMDGTQFGTPDPRLSRMLSPSPDGVYRGLDINLVTGFGAYTTTQRPMNFFGTATTPPAGTPSRFIFDDKTKFPLITYAQLQFVKAEAAYRAGDKATALTAYRNAVTAHVDWVNARNQDAGQTPTQITSAEKTAFLNDPNIIPASAANLTLSHIMSQKYIAQWGWGHLETWMDLRRYHYTDVDPAAGKQVFRGFAIPLVLQPENNGKTVQRIRPRYNSEYVWNLDALKVIGGDALDFHTKPLWITLP